MALWVMGCELPPGPPDPSRLDLADSVGTDGGLDVDALAALDGNLLPLDGGATGFAHLVFTLSDRDTQLPVPARVIFRPVPGAGFADSITSGTPDVASPGSFTGAVVGPGVLGAPEGVLLASGQGVVPVPPGTYALLVMRGPEYEAVPLDVTVAAGEVRTYNVQLDHSVDTRGWLSADLHVHTARSFDAKLLLDRRVISMTTSGVDVVVSTDHNVHTDLQPVITALGYGKDVIGTVIGNEFNFKEGHGGAYPVPYNPAQMYGGALPYQNLNPSTLLCDAPVVGINCLTATSAFPTMHGLSPNTVVTVNHPWYDNADLGYFTNIGWGAGTPSGLPAPLASAGQFDALEILGGYWTRADAETYLVADWFYLLGQGHRIAALGSSDTHRINWVRAGYPRTWLRLPNDLPGDITGAGLADAIRNQRTIASTGPFITLTVDGAQIGQVVTPKTAGKLAIEISVDAPGWMKVDTVRLYVNGVEKRTFAVPPGQRPVFKASFTEDLVGDGFVVAHCSGTTPLPPDVVGEYSRDNGYQMLPWAITSPVYIDADGDGSWKPPAAPVPRGGLRRPDIQPVQVAHVTPVDCDPTPRPGLRAEPPLPAERALMPLLDF